MKRSSGRGPNGEVGNYNLGGTKFPNAIVQDSTVPAGCSRIRGQPAQQQGQPDYRIRRRRESSAGPISSSGRWARSGLSTIRLRFRLRSEAAVCMRAAFFRQR